MYHYSKNLSELTHEVVAIYKRYTTTGTNPWTYDTASRDLPYQVGSLTKLMMQLTGNRHAEGKNEDEIKSQVGDELADILAETLFIAHELNINLEEAWNKMLKSDELKIKDRVL